MKRGPEELSPREEEAVRFLANGLVDKEIAVQMHIKCGTVRTHVFNAKEKLGASNRAQLALLAQKYFFENGDAPHGA